MVKIITFEGIDYSGKTTALIHLAKRFSKRQELIFNEGLIYQDELTSRLLTIANQCNEQEKESLYTSLYILDTLKSSTLFFKDTRTFFQDRYWPSVIAYGKFLNGEKSIHNNKDFRPLFIYPSVVIHFTCSHSEKIRRSEQRERKSLLDKFLFENNLKVDFRIDGYQA